MKMKPNYNNDSNDIDAMSLSSKINIICATGKHNN